ncbi:MAG: YkgJ family cysteine cluster protein [Planctomycetes bacterium]|nr:YkgJ family cysteine cluster protein [Planctomycetota bacterium]MBI3833619.1 YkgJ family cysteine cluster protein [Planctomycetota bacterium]
MAKEKWYSQGLKFTCTQCGNCCTGEPGYVWVTRDEVKRISEFLGRNDGWLDPAQIRRVGLSHSLTERPNGDCTFLARENGKAICTIYPVRPKQCRTWPFWDELLESRDAWNDTHKRICPGMNTGKHHEFVQIETVRRGTE